MSKILVAACLFFVGCSPLRHYQKVAADPFRNSAERAILRPVCIAEWPVQIEAPKLVKVGVDSSDYEAALAAYNEILDQLIQAYERDTTHSETVIKLCTPLDSIRIIKNFLSWYKPAPIVKTEYIETQVRDTKIEDDLKSQVAACRAENDNIRADAQKDRDKLASRTRNMWIAIGASVLLFVIGVGYFIGKIRVGL